MIFARLIRADDGTLAGFHLKGHAGYAAHGQDIVCAAASMLAINCVNSLEAVAHVTPLVSQQEKDGELTVQLPHDMTADERHDAQVLLLALQQGFKDLAETYPGHFRWQSPEIR